MPFRHRTSPTRKQNENEEIFEGDEEILVGVDEGKNDDDSIFLEQDDVSKTEDDRSEGTDGSVAAWTRRPRKDILRDCRRTIIARARAQSLRPSDCPQRFVGMRFALSQGENVFGEINPPKWGKVAAYHDNCWTIVYEDHVSSTEPDDAKDEVFMYEDEDYDSDAKRAQRQMDDLSDRVQQITDEQFQSLVKKIGMDKIVRGVEMHEDISMSHDADTKDDSDEDVIDAAVVSKRVRQYVDLKFTLKYTPDEDDDEGQSEQTRNTALKKNEDMPSRRYWFCIVTDYFLCKTSSGEEREVWIVLRDDNHQDFLFHDDLMRLIRQKVRYDAKFNKLNVTTFTRHIVEHWLFEAVILILIFANCVVLVAEKEDDVCDDGEYACEETNEDVWYAFNMFFTLAFFVEMVMKMIGLGLIRKTREHVGYFRDGWNYLDFAIVIEGIVNLFTSSSSSLSGIRALRVLRPLRVVTHLPGLKLIVDAFVKSIPLLCDTLLICAFYFVVFGICGLQVFLGEYRSRCFDIESGELDADLEFTCGGAVTCSAESYCGSHISNPNYGVTSFDNLLVSFLTIFQAITLEGWVDIMYWGMDSVSPWVWVYFILMIMFGALILINLTLAVILSKFNEGRAKLKQQQREKLRSKSLIFRKDEAMALVFQVDVNSRAGRRKIRDMKQAIDREEKKRTVAVNVSEVATTTNDTADDATWKKSLTVDTSGETSNDQVSNDTKISDEDTKKHGGERTESKGSSSTSSSSSVKQRAATPVPESRAKTRKLVLWSNEDGPSCVIHAPRWMYVHHPTVRVWCTHTRFEIAMCVLIVANMIILSMDHYPQSNEFEDRLETINTVFTAIFALEVLFKWVGLGVWDYFRDPLNQVDFVVVAAGLVELIFLGSSSFTAFRAVRFARLVKLVRFMESLQQILRVLGKSIGGLFYISMLLLLFTTIYAILGMQFFQHKLVDGEGNVPRNNYDSFHWAFVSVFQVLAGENWPALMYDGIDGTSWLIGSTFYVSWVVVGQFILLNLFLAVLMANFDDIGVNTSETKAEADTKADTLTMLEKAEEDTKAATENAKNGADTKTGELADDKKKRKKKEEEESEESTTTVARAAALTKKMFRMDDTVQKDEDTKKATAAKTEDVKSLSGTTTDDESLTEAEIERAKHLGGTHSTNLFIVTKGGTLHVNCLDVVLSAWFTRTIICLILLSSITLALECPATLDKNHEDSTYDDDQDDQWILALHTFDMFFCTMFGLEAVLKCIAFGFVMHPNAYLRNGWNVLDFVVVIASVTDLSLDLEAVSVLRIFRLIRVLRPLRVIQRNPGLRRVVNALVLSFNALRDILLVLIFVWILFALVGVQFFKGRLYTCSDESFPPDTSRYGVCAVDGQGDCLLTSNGSTVYVVPPCDSSVTTYMQQDSSNASIWTLTENVDALGVQRAWVNSDMNFDNVYDGFLVLFVSASGEGWPDVMFQTSDITDMDRTPKLNNTPYYAYFWVVYITVVCFFFAELFVGAVFNKFCELRKEAEAKNERSVFLTEWQQEWVDQQKLLLRTRPRKAKRLPYFWPSYYRRVLKKEVPDDTIVAQTLVALNAARKQSNEFVKSEMFETFILSCIIVNTIIIAMPFYEMGVHYESFLYWSNFILTIVFLVEMVLKHFALSLYGYWRDSWNQFDGVLVIVSMLDIFVEVFPASVFRILRLGRVIGRMMRLGRVMRIGRAAKALEGLVKIMTTLWLSLPALVNVGALLFLLFFIFAILAVNLFGDLPLESPHSSFVDFPNAMLTLFRIATGEDWQNLMYACYDGEYGQFVAAIYFIAFVFLAAFIILNLFVAIIAENFEEDVEDEDEDSDGGDDFERESDLVIDRARIDRKPSEVDKEKRALETRHLTRKFVRAWATVDPSAVQFIPKGKLRDLLILIGPPLGLEADATTAELENVVMSLKLTKVKDHVNFTEVLMALHRKLFQEIADTIPDSIQDEYNITSESVHALVMEKTIKRSKSSTLGGRKNSSSRKAEILRVISENHNHGVISPKAWKALRKDLTFEIMLRRVQRAWRAKIARRRLRAKLRKDDETDLDDFEDADDGRKVEESDEVVDGDDEMGSAPHVPSLPPTQDGDVRVSIELTNFA